MRPTVPRRGVSRPAERHMALHIASQIVPILLGPNLLYRRVLRHNIRL